MHDSKKYGCRFLSFVWLFFLIDIVLFPVLAFADDPFHVTFSSRPKHAVLYIIDGLSYKAWERVSLPVLEAMISQGAFVEKNYLPTSAHPTEGAYAELHTCSIPNPILMAGTVFITKETAYLPQVFFPKETTVFVANTEIYDSLNRFYHYSYQKLGPDTDGVAKASEFMKLARPAFMRVHLQEVGEESFQIMSLTENVPWRRNIWAEGSPYIQRLKDADRLLMTFLQSLQDLGILKDTVILITSDHGEADSGYHPTQNVDASITSIVLWGAGVKKNVRIPYAEHIDVVPTICALMGKSPPKTCQGRVIVEALEKDDEIVPPRKMLIKDMLEQFGIYRKMTAEANNILENLVESPDSIFFRNLNNIQQEFYDVHKFARWPEFKTLEELLSHNRRILSRLSILLSEIRSLK
ncbi:MAG: sulfatase-like hydrolase/transferase [Candidatus Aminicenantes bacterium]|nr:sulfatase-like hydrolase/transferase [Candidatus Aminicenantes bacterium]